MNTEAKQSENKYLRLFLEIPLFIILLLINGLIMGGVSTVNIKGNVAQGIPISLIDGIIYCNFIGLLITHFIMHLGRMEIPPDPWSDLIDDSEISKTHMVCRYCLSIENNSSHFCSNCQRGIGLYNTSMPFLWITSLGEILLDGVRGNWRKTTFNKIMFCFFAFWQYAFLAPWYLKKAFKAVNNKVNKA